MGDLRTNLTSYECRCRCSYADCEVVTQHVMPAAALMDMFQAAREALGERIDVTSCARCVKHNIDVGGSTKSSHCMMAPDVPIVQAMDVQPATRERTLELFFLLHKLGARGLGLYTEPDVVHFDVVNREQNLGWIQDGARNRKYYPRGLLSRYTLQSS